MKLLVSLSATFGILHKEIRSELRTRYALNALVMFVVTTLSVILFAIGGENVSREVLSGILWIIIFFSAMSGLSRTFVAEEERGTVMTLHLIARPLSVYFGKFLYNLLLLGVLNIFTLILYLFFIPGFSIGSYSIFAVTVILGTFGLASASTIIAAIVAKAGTKGTLYPVLAFPILLPLLLTLINATRLAVEGVDFNQAIGEFKVLISYAVTITAISYLLFDYIWKE